MSWVSCSPKGSAQEAAGGTDVGSSSEPGGEALTHGWHIMTATRQGHWLKGRCFLDYLQKRSGSAPAHTVTLTSYLFNQWRCTIQRGESPLFTLCIYSLCCEIVCWDRRAFSPLGQTLCCPSVSQAGQVIVLWGRGRQHEKQHTLIPVLLQPVLLPWSISIVMPQGFMLSDSAPK